jgi:hypothetical protein
MPIELVGNLRLHRKLNASSQVVLAFKHCQNLCIVDLSIKESHEVYSTTHVYPMGVRSGGLGIFVLLYLGVPFSTFGQVKIPHQGGMS